MNYFEGIGTIASGERRYRQLAKRLHPDNQRTGDADAFREMASEWEILRGIIQTQGEVKAPRRRSKPSPPVTPTATPPPPDPILEEKDAALRTALHGAGMAAADLLLSTLLRR